MKCWLSGAERKGKWGDVGQMVQIYSHTISSDHLIYSTMTRVNNIVLYK